MKLRATLLLTLAASALAVSALGGTASAQVTAPHKPGPPPSIAIGHITADQQKHPCLTAASTLPGARVFVAPCVAKLNATQRWKTVRYRAVIIVALQGHPGSCLGGKPLIVKQGKQVFHYAVTHDCSQNIPLHDMLTIGHVGGPYNTIINAEKRLLSAPHRAGSGRMARWLFPDGNIPFTQVWLFPKFKPV